MSLPFNTLALLALLLFIEGCTPKKITINTEEKSTSHVIAYETIMVQEDVVEEKMLVENTVEDIVEEKIEDKKYLSIMNDLDELIFTKLDIELNRDKDWIIHNKKNIVVVLDEFISKSQQLETDTPSHLMTEEYMDFVKSLVYKGNFLKGLVEKESVSKMGKGVSMITNTCNNCHAVYQ